MLRFPKIKSETKNLIHQMFKPRNMKSFISQSFPKKSFCLKTKNISEKLSFLKSEEEMRKYFNIVDYDKEDADKIFEKELKDEREKFSQIDENYKKLNRKILSDYIQKYKSQLQNTEKDESHKNPFEIINEYSLPLEELNFVKNKPNNYIFVTNIIHFEEEHELIHQLEEFGKITSYKFVKDLIGENAGLEVYYEKENSANIAYKYLNNKQYNDHFLRIKTNKDSDKEEVNNKTIIIKNLNPTLSHSAILDELSAYGSIVKLEMPLVNKIDPSNKINRVIELGEKYLNILISNIETNSLNKIKINEKARYNFYLGYLKNVINKFKNVLENNNNEISIENQLNLLNNLLVEMNFFLKKFFPDLVVNSIIKEQFQELEKMSKNSSNDLLGNSLQFRKKAFDTIFTNIEKLVKRYDDKLNSLAKPLTREEILVDLQDFQDGTKDPEKINENFLKKPDGYEELHVIKKLEDMKLYSSFYPLEQKIAKYNFFKSLSEEEKKMISDKYNLSLSLNEPEYLDYFLKFNRAMGIELFDKYIELTKKYISMSPAEKLYFAKNIIAHEYEKNDIPEYKDGILDYLELKNIYNQLNIKDQEHYSDIKDPFIDFKFSLIADSYKSTPRLNFSEFNQLLFKNRLIREKQNYLRFISPINLRRNVYYAKKVRKMICVYNNDVNELIKNYSLVKDSNLKENYDSVINGMKKTKFPNIYRSKIIRSRKDENLKMIKDSQSQIKSKGEQYLYGNEDNIVEEREATLEDFKDVDNEEEIIKSASREYKDHFKYTGLGMNEGQIINRLEHLRTSLSRILDFIMNISDKMNYKKLKIEKIDNKIKKKLKEDAELLFSDDPEIKSYYLKKINDQLSKFSYVNEYKLKDQKFTFKEICEDLIYREENYMHRTKIALNALSNINENLQIKVNKNNIVEAVSINNVLMHLNQDYGEGEKFYRKKHFHGSPTIAYITNVKTIFENELKKVEKIKDHKMKELNIPSLDEAQSKRMDLIENYTNKIAEYELLNKERLENEIKEELENYKFEYFLNGENFDNIHISQPEFNVNINGNILNLLDLEKELIKKEFEVIQNITKNPEYIQEYKDVSSLVKNISNLKKEANLNDSILDKPDRILKKRRLTNKGYAFVTFVSSDQAKKLFIEGLFGLRIKNKLCDIEPKFSKTHNDMDIIKLIEIAKKDSVLLTKQDEIKQAENKIFEFERQLDKKLDKKQEEIKEIISAYRDLYSDPFKKHDANNPLSKEEEEKLKYGLKKLEKEKGINNYWILEEEKLEELRKIKDKRMTKTYFDWQLLKKGVFPQEMIKKFEDDSQKNSYLDKWIKGHFSDKEKYELNITPDAKNYTGGRLLGDKIANYQQFIENILGKDFISKDEYGFKPDKRDEIIYNEIKELRERFPKEIFDEKLYGESEEKDLIINSNLDNLMESLNKKYINLLNKQEVKNGELTKNELLDRITNLSPVNKKIQLIITERNRLLEEDDIKQKVTLNNFINNVDLRQLDENAKLNDPMDEDTQFHEFKHVQYYNSNYKKFWEFDSRLVNFVDEDQLKNINAEKEELETPQEGDSSFNAFIVRRKIFLDKQDQKQEKDKKTQFDSSKISLDVIQEVASKKKEKLVENIKLKYKVHMNAVITRKDDIEKRNSVELKINEANIKDNIFDYVKNKKIVNKEKLEKLNEMLNLEKKKGEFIAELERNFSKEIETLPNFKEYFDSLKNNLDPLEAKIKSDNLQVDNLKDLFSYKIHNSLREEDPYRNMIALLNKGNLTNDQYEKYFLKHAEKIQTQFEEWLSEENIKAIIEELKYILGITPENEKEMMKILEAKYPLLFDDSIDHLAKFRELSEKIDIVENMEDCFENEYIFSAKPFDLLVELVRISKLKNVNVSVKFDEIGYLVIKREFKNTYKYDLDTIMNFDVEKERSLLIEKINKNNFVNEYLKEVKAIAKFFNNVKEGKINMNCFKGNLQEYFKNMIEQFDTAIKKNYNRNFSFFDLKNAIEKFENLPVNTIKEFLNSIITIINMPNINNQTSLNVNENLRIFSKFSNGIFVEREIESFAFFAFFDSLTKDEGKDIPIIDSEFTIQTQADFISLVILKNVENFLKHDLKKSDFFVLGCLFKNSYNLKEDPKLMNVIKYHVWKNYKEVMNQKYSILFNKEREISFDPISEIASNINEISDLIHNRAIEKTLKNNPEIEKIDKEINEFSSKLQEYYVDIANLNTSDDYIDYMVSDDELFFEEISEQIEKRILRQKNNERLTKMDLIKKRYNESDLLKKQINDVEKYEKYLEGLTYNDYYSENKEMLTELRRVISLCKKRRETLLSKGKPLVDYDFPRLI